MEGKGLINTLTSLFENMDGRITRIEQCGCPEGNIRKERLENVRVDVSAHKVTIEKIFDKIDDINNKFFWGLLALCIIAMMAGINIANVLHLIPK